MKHRKARVKAEPGGVDGEGTNAALERPEDAGAVAARDAANEAGPAADLAHTLLARGVITRREFEVLLNGPDGGGTGPGGLRRLLESFGPLATGAGGRNFAVQTEQNGTKQNGTMKIQMEKCERVKR